MHLEYPEVYRDPNPKPEIAIALSDDFTACFGFASPDTIRANLAGIPILSFMVEQLCGANPSTEDFPDIDAAFLQSLIKQLFTSLNHDEERLEAIITKMHEFCLDIEEN